MRNNILLKGLVPTLVLFSTQAAAVPFQSIDPRSFGMGGTGAASGNAANAGFMNPALLAAAKDGEDFALELPIIAARIMDEDELLDEIDTYKDSNLEASLTAAIDAFGTTPSDANAQIVAARAAALNAQLVKMDNRAVQGEGNVGVVVGIPSKKFGVSLTLNAWGVGGGFLDYSDHDQQLIGTDIGTATTAAELLAIGEVTAQTGGGTNVADTLTSNLKARGAIIKEVGLSFAREVNIAGHDFALGITPKYVKVTTFEYLLDVNTADFDTDKGKKDDSNFNLDIGVAKDYGNGWKTGLVVKNIIAQDYKTAPFASSGLTATSSELKIEPQARIGVAHSTDWTTVALDIDLAENEAAGFESKTQYAAIGAELDIFDTVQLRVGYRHNMSDSDTSIATAGIGFSIFGAHADVAVGANEDEIGGSFQMGFRF